MKVGPVSHTFQCITGCTVGPDGRLLRGYSHHAYDGQDYIALREDLKRWSVSDSAPQSTQQRWKDSGVAEIVGAFLEVGCVQTLLSYLEIGEEILLCTGTKQPKGSWGTTLGLGLKSPKEEYRLSLSHWEGKECFWVSNLFGD